MKPVKRYGVNKRRSAKKFRKSVSHTNKRNVSGPMRGGIRM
jgi:hypothetical protein